MDNINKLNDAWIEKGQKVSDLANKLSTMALDDKITDEDFKKVTNEYNEAKAKRDQAKQALDIARANPKLSNDSEPGNPKPIDKGDNKLKFVDKFVGMVRHDPKVINSLGSNVDGNGNAGLTIPFDQQTQIHQLVRQYQSLEPLVNVENVTTKSGSRVWEKFKDITPLVDLDDETAAIADNDDPELTLIKYEIHRHSGINTVTNTLLNDTAENLLAWLNTWIARKEVVTRNKKILEAIGTQPKKPTITKFDDIKDVIEVDLDPAIAATSTIITNVSGFNVLSKVKDNKGRYLIEPDPTEPAKKQIDGKPVMVISDKWLPDNAGAHPFIFGDLKQGITLFDRQKMSLLSTNIGDGAFRNDSTKIRVIDRFDVQMTDDGAFVNASFKEIPDQVPVAAPTADSGTTK